MVRDIDVSVIIVNWNTRDITCECLQSVYDQTHNITFEVILVDNDSSDGSVEAIRSQFPQVQLIENKDNKGFAAANNQGFELARGRYVLLLNPDTVVLDGAIQKTVAFMDTRSDAAVVGIRNDDRDGNLAKNCFQFASIQNLIISTMGLHRAFPKSKLFGRERLLWWDYLSVREVDVVAGCYMLVRAEAMDEVGVMDEGYFMYGEEMEWCWRFNQAGWKILYYPDASIIHYGGMSAAQNPVGMHMEQRKSYLRFIRARQGAIAEKAAQMLICLNGLTRLGYWGILSLVIFGKRRELVLNKIKKAKVSAFQK